LTVPTPAASGRTSDKRWLAAITELHGRLEEPFRAEFELTQAKAESLAKLFRSCSPALARVGAPSDRLQPAYRLVRQACAHYDKAAECLATAARYLSVDLPSGPEAERRLDQALQCSAAAEGDGANLLTEAEALGSQLHDARG
jgi:hypothetical protein